MATLLFPIGKIIPVPRGVPLPLGRADIARYSEAITVSRVQCTVESLNTDNGQSALKLTSKGSQNPTVVIGLGEQPRELHQGQSVLLRDGDKFSLISTRPDLAIRVQLPGHEPAAAGNAAAAASAAAAAVSTAAAAAAASAAESGAGTDGAMAETTPKPPGGAGPELSDKRHTPAAAESYSSRSEAYTSDEGGEGGAEEEDGGACGGGGRGAASEGGPRPSPTAAGTAGAAQGLKAAGRKGCGGRGGKGGARGGGNGKPPARTTPPVLLLLAGLPGSGKSTFSRELLRTSPVAWVHVNQDAISDGKRGTREQCLAAARAALEEGACCVVDRCHADAAQRDVLKAVAAERGLAAHCVALQMPLELCAKRVAARTDHPGGVQGDSFKKLVYTMAGQMKKSNSWPPAASEGFTSVMDCHNDADATAAVRSWAVYGSDDTSAQAAGAGAPSATAAATSGAESGGRLDAAAAAGPPPTTHGSAGTRQDVPPRSASAAAAADAAAATLAMWRDYVAKRKSAPSGIMSFFKPSGTAAKKESPGGAAAAKAGDSGLPAAKGAGVSAPGAPGASAVGGVAAASRGEPARASRGGEAAGKAAAVAAGAKTAAQDKTSAGATRRPRSEPTADERSVKRQAVEAPKAGGRGGGNGGGGAVATGVSASPARGAAGSGKAGSAPDACGDSPSQGRSEGNGQGGSSQSGRNAFSVLMASASRKAADGHGSASASGGGGGDEGSRHPGGAHTGDEPDPRFKLGAPWAQALRNTALHPEQAQQEVLYKDDQVIMIRDVYPKAKHHALVIARDPALRSIADLRQEHLQLLAHMQQVACKWVQEARTKDPVTVAFKLGFHAVPSMCQVHMHVVSQDFDSPALKNKKHWNSFTTQFFLPLEVVQHELESRGRLTLIDQNVQHQLEGQELRCHGCAKTVKTMPEIKKHIVACDAVKRLPGL
ncbi:hypothetical protein PLESTB_000165900 [Pleodorina starrii]|uniref:HIT domain-containing protein n=1 Tax=Pleodorina starrii TaxID=330485 RepID=A0A9W6EYC5_9CHLO|nr:hypothetical protein PLESTB_000165900 [Pleodorina starrii]